MNLRESEVQTTSRVNLPDLFFNGIGQEKTDEKSFLLSRDVHTNRKSLLNE